LPLGYGKKLQIIPQSGDTGYSRVESKERRETAKGENAAIKKKKKGKKRKEQSLECVLYFASSVGHDVG
jgi:hypothetical protein